jgi:hypothetical protein
VRRLKSGARRSKRRPPAAATRGEPPVTRALKSQALWLTLGYLGLILLLAKAWA